MRVWRDVEREENRRIPEKLDGPMVHGPSLELRTVNDMGMTRTTPMTVFMVGDLVGNLFHTLMKPHFHQ